MRWMTVHAGFRLRDCLVDLKVQKDFAGARLLAGNLHAIQVDQAQVIRLQVVLAHQRRRADHFVGPDAIRDIAAIAVDIGAVP